MGRLRLAGIRVVFLVAGIVFMLGVVALRRTVGGLRSYAIGGDAPAPSAPGADVPSLLTYLTVCMGGAVGLVAMLTFGRLSSASPNPGVGLEIAVIIAVILGGVRFAGGRVRPLGLFFGGIAIGIRNVGVIFVGLSDYWRTIIGGTVLTLALGADPLNELRRVRSLVLRLARTLANRGGAVLMITHDVESARLIVDRGVVLNRGHVLFDDDADGVSTRDVIYLKAGLELERTREAAIDDWR